MCVLWDYSNLINEEAEAQLAASTEAAAITTPHILKAITASSNKPSFDMSGNKQQRYI